VIVGGHGDGLGEHSHVGHTRYLYQEDIRVPLLIYDGGATSADAVYKNDTYATLIDVAPTIVERLGLMVPKGWQGRSLLAPPHDRITFHQTRRGRDPCFAAVERTSTKLMKYIRCGSGNEIREELFDIIADPHERTNLIDKIDAAVLRRYRHEIDSRFAIVTNSCMAFECRD
jgi:arylsulfatase A-like enzyme